MPVLALLAAAAMTGYVGFSARKASEAPQAVAAPVPTAPPAAIPAPSEEPPPVAAPVEEPAPAPPADPAPADPAPTPPNLVVEPVPEPPPEPPTPMEPPVTADSLLDGVRAAVAGIRCADLRAELTDGAVRIAGTVTSPDDADRVQRIAEALPEGAAQRPAVAVASPTLCEPLLLTEPLRGANTARGRPLSVATVPDGTLAGGQDLVLDLRSTAAAGAVQVDYFTVDGGVVHLLPNPSEPAAALEPGAARRLGERSGKTRFWTIGPPFGQELIVVVTSASPLFPTPRPEAEPAAAYLAALQRALAGPATEGALAAALFITTRAP
ncbi:DUF4384 domain-containing protein [Azospirillum sp. TSO22-1]|uniref:DUF4384 domain-containing protein n=1 Tax=Azospirillum sp. TSO22-1 TaxID=716789 RepID=UPI0011B640B1|nr:DUF4384 domain-containing protein [Azospirillum sp. TSO22-1]